jgi:hypothetical protein
MKLKQSILIGGSTVLTIAGLLLVPYPNLNRIQALLFAGGAAAGFTAGVKGRQLEQDQETFDLQVFEAKQHQKMLEQTTLPVLQQEEMAIAKSRAEAHVQIKSLEHQQHLQTLKQLKFPGLLEAEIEEARRRSELEKLEKMGRGDRGAEQSSLNEKAEVHELLPASESDRPFAKDWTFKTLPPEYQWLSHFSHTSGLIWGNQGSGKSWLARAIAYMKQQMGYRVVVLDPDSNKYEWKNIESYHKPEDIKKFLKWYVKEIKDRYREFNDAPMGEKEWREKLWKEGKAISVICEEATTYKNILPKNESEAPEQSVDDLLTDFYELGFSKSRKQEMPLTVVAHNNTQMIFGIKGLGQLIAKLLQIELEVMQDPITKNPVSKGVGVLKLDSSNDLIPVKTPAITEKITDFAVNSDTMVERTIAIEVNPDLDIEGQRTTLARIYKQSPNDVPPWDEWSSELTTEEIDRLIDERRSRRDNTSETTSNTPEFLSEVPESGIGDEISLEPLQDIEYPRKWDADTFRRILPKEDENALFEKILKYLDASLDTSGDRTKSYSKVIKFGLGFNKPRSHGTRSYWNVGLPCFRYLLGQPGRETLKHHFSKAWDADNEEE